MRPRGQPNRDRDDELFDLTDFDVKEVSWVDHPANRQDFLVVKRSEDVDPNEIIGNGHGEFSTPGGGSGGSGGGEGEGEAEKQKLKIQTPVKVAVLTTVTESIERLMAIGRAVKGAEETDEKLPTPLPNALGKEIKAVAELLGSVDQRYPSPKPEAKTPEEEEAEKKAEAEAAVAKAAEVAAEEKKKAEAAASDDAAKTESFEKTLTQLANILEGIKGQLGLTEPKAAKDDKDGEAPAEQKPAPLDPEVEKRLLTALTGVSEVLKRQGEAITGLRERVGLPASGQPEGGTQVKKTADEEYSWPWDMNSKETSPDRP